MRYFYWPGMVVDVRRFIINSEFCRPSKVPNQILQPFLKLYVDLIGPFPRSKKGNMDIFIVLDHFSKYKFLKPLKHFCSNNIIRFMWVDIFHCFGLQETIVSDNGSQFKCKEFKGFADSHDVKYICIAVHAPQSNVARGLWGALMKH